MCNKHEVEYVTLFTANGVGVGSDDLICRYYAEGKVLKLVVMEKVFQMLLIKKIKLKFKRLIQKGKVQKEQLKLQMVYKIYYRCNERIRN